MSYLCKNLKNRLTDIPFRDSVANRKLAMKMLEGGGGYQCIVDVIDEPSDISCRENVASCFIAGYEDAGRGWGMLLFILNQLQHMTTIMLLKI